jgi:hypothetical protein
MIRKRDKTNAGIFYVSCIRQENRQEKNIEPALYSEANKTISQFYESISQSGLVTRNSYDCFALRLARLILSILQDEKNCSVSDGALDEAFYSACIEEAAHEGMLALVKDRELLLIYIKQMVLLLRNAGIISLKKVRAVANKSYENSFLFLVDLFDSFWNKSPWRKLFPSDPEAAAKLKTLRTMLKEIILSAENRTDIEKLSNDFFNLTGFASENDLFMISFLDFYVFTWLKHFGLVHYFVSGKNSAVSIELTNTGKIFFSAVS